MRSLIRRREAQLARLADGSLPAARSRELREQAAASAALGAELAAQERVVSLLRGFDEPAPASLHARVGQMVEESQASPQPAAAPGRVRRKPGTRVRRRSISFVTVLAAALIAVVLTLGNSTPTLGQTVHLALASSTMPAPARTASGNLALSGGGIMFPSWFHQTAWHATGARIDTIAGRRVTTVFYTDYRGRRIGYAIVSGRPLSVPRDMRRTVDGMMYTVAQTGKVTAVTWVHAGHTCVIAGRSVSVAVALALATDA